MHKKFYKCHFLLHLVKCEVKGNADDADLRGFFCLHGNGAVLKVHRLHRLTLIFNLRKHNMLIFSK